MADQKREEEEEEFEEVQVWDVVMKEKERGESFNPRQRKSSSSSSSCLSAAWHLPLPAAGAKMKKSSKARSCGNEGEFSALQQSSAPVEVPDWSKIYREKKSNRGIDDDQGGKGIMIQNENGDFVEIEDGDEDDEMIPPHEYIARRLERTRIASHSMCEGIGRTLKGRDLCKLRNAILTQTGFLEE